MNPGGFGAGELERASALARDLAPAESVFAVRAPGRVNLIGEHTDYSGLPVLPVAIDRSTVIVAAPRPDSVIDLANANPDYPARRFNLAPNIPPYPAGDWANYVKAAVQGVIAHFGARGDSPELFRGATLRVDGRVPVAAGLSSSAALTVASALAFMAVNGLELAPLEAAAMVAQSERYVGTMAGGMDQTVSMMGRRDHAVLIEFDPLSATAVPIPSGAAIVVADSLEVADKSGTVRDEYNRRVVECSVAARIIARVFGIDRVTTLGDVVKRLDNWQLQDLAQTLAAIMPERIDGGIEAAANFLEIPQQHLRAALLGEGPNRIALDESRPLECLRRARHVLSETQRVYRAVEALRAGGLADMGRLMDESHRSLHEDFEVSTGRLDRMVECARDAGAFGARLTGAGFGGCIVALADSTRADDIIRALERDYYARLGGDAAKRALHTTMRAGAGASVIRLR